MVVLTEEFHGLSLKRKGALEPDLFDDAGDRSSVFSLSCRATKMRRLACPDGPRDGDMGGAVTTAWEEDVAMGDAAAAPSPSPGAFGEDDERAVVVYGDGDGSSRRIDAPRLRADWIRAMLREADSRTVRELLTGAALERGSESDLALAVVPWVAPTPEEEVATEEASDGEDGAAAMDVEGQEGRSWTWTGQGQATQAYGTAAGEGLVYPWPQHCWTAPAVAQASPVMWSW
ncbi:uncharacterized protein [Miscanthus floridulus]|uniref:uncharacterized protein n=1 Tax=Miscanthus floridulus TaxID=154761 RepID=UPI00345AABE7